MDQVDGKCFSRIRTLVNQCTGEGEGEEETDSNIENYNNNNNNMAQAVVSTSRYAEYYKMNHPRRGLALIFNHQHFLSSQEREATDEDAIKLKKCLSALRFEAHIFKDLTLREIRTQIDIAVNAEHRNADCILVAVLTHGDENCLHASDTSYNPQKELYDKFKPDNCPGLAGKPKIFVLQACQGKKTDPGTRLQGTTEFDDLKSYRIPNAADFLFIYATPPGYYAFRNTVAGSYFIKVLCEQLELFASSDHLLDILTTVNNRVAVEFVSSNTNKDYNDKKQMPYFVPTLTKKIHFNYPHVVARVDTQFFIEN